MNSLPLDLKQYDLLDIFVTPCLGTVEGRNKVEVKLQVLVDPCAAKESEHGKMTASYRCSKLWSAKITI